MALLVPREPGRGIRFHHPWGTAFAMARERSSHIATAVARRESLRGALLTCTTVLGDTPGDSRCMVYCIRSGLNRCRASQFPRKGVRRSAITREPSSHIVTADARKDCTAFAMAREPSSHIATADPRRGYLRGPLLACTAVLATPPVIPDASRT